LESGTAGEQTRLHLDRCLTCRNCETACPSGMQYGELLDIGRGLIASTKPRDRRLTGSLRWMLRFVLTRPGLLSIALAVGRAVRPLLPAALRATLPARQGRAVLPRRTARAPC
jgi:glycolate oxidase iron-sulfur subunit